MKLLAALIVLSIPVAAANATPPEAGNASASESGTTETIGEDSDKVICKREKISGSRVTAKRICLTAAQWERQRREDQQAVEKVQTARMKSS